MMRYGHGATRIDLNGPHGTMTSLIRIADHWARLLGYDRVHVALALTYPTTTTEELHDAFAAFFGDYATLYEGTPGRREAETIDPFAAWPFECQRPTPPFEHRFTTMPPPLKELYMKGVQSKELEAWIAEYTAYETDAVAFLLENYARCIQ